MGIATATVIHKVVVVAETAELSELAMASVAELGKKLRNKRVVEAQVKRFGRAIAADPSALRIEVFDVVGFCNPTTERPNVLEPIVIHQGKPVPVVQRLRQFG